MSNKIPFTEPIGGKQQGQQNLNWAIDQNGNAFFAGDVRINGDLVADDITIDDLTMDSLTITGNATIGGTLSVTGAASLLTSLETPVIYGGTGVTSGITVKATTGVGTTGLVTVSAGNNGGIVVMQAGTSGVVFSAFNSGAPTYTALFPTSSQTGRMVLVASADSNIGTSGLGQVVATGKTNPQKTMTLGVDTTNNRGVLFAQEFGVASYSIRVNNILDLPASNATDIVPVTDNSLAFGTAALRFTTIRLSTSAIIGTALTVGGSFTVESGNAILSATTLGTTATSGFAWIPICAGVPTGIPTGFAAMGSRPIVYNSTNGKLWIYNAGSWGLV